MLLLGPLDRVQAARRSVVLAVNVDDFSLQRFGGEERVGQELEQTADCLVSELTKVDMQLAVDKGRVLSNSKSLRLRLARNLRHLGIQAANNHHR